MKSSIFYLKPTAPMHLQTGGGDHESVDHYPRSDTFSAALSYWWFRQFGELPGFPEQPCFRCSSLFPAIQVAGKVVRLYPKPAGIDIDPDKNNHKVFKKVRWVDEGFFEGWRTGAFNDSWLPENSGDSRLKRNGSVLVKEPATDVGRGPLQVIDALTRVTLDRVSAKSVPFHFVRVLYADDLLFWFYCDVNEKEMSRLISLIRLLGDEGIGADRTVGLGHYSFITSEEVTLPSATGKVMNLGLYNPTSEETQLINWQDSYYQLEKRSGWVTGKRLRRKPLTCVAENALLSVDSTPRGSMRCVLDKEDPQIPEEVKPEYSVYRDCRGYFISTNH